MSVTSVFEQLVQAAGIKLVNSTELYPALRASGLARFNVF